MIEFRSDHRALARDRQPLRFKDGSIVVDEEGAAKLRRLARRKPYLGIVEVGPVAPVAVPEPAKKPRTRKPKADVAPAPAAMDETGPAPVEPATPADEPASPADEADSPASSDSTAGDGE